MDPQFAPFEFALINFEFSFHCQYIIKLEHNRNVTMHHNTNIYALVLIHCQIHPFVQVLK